MALIPAKEFFENLDKIDRFLEKKVPNTDNMYDELDKFPILPPRVRRRSKSDGNKTT